MKYLLAGLAVIFAGLSHAQVKCEANLNGFKIHSVYIMGDQYEGVVWGYKHIAEATCLTPTTDLARADAILEIHRRWTPGSEADMAPLSVSCSSNRDSTVCSDSAGNELRVDCRGGDCTSYYGPSLASAASGALKEWLSTRWYESEARLFTVDRKILWKSEDQKGAILWPDKLRLGTNSPVCKVGGYMARNKYRNFRQWASEKCSVEFEPLVSIDLKLQSRGAIEKEKQDSKDEMIRNAQDAAAKQKRDQN